MKKSIIIKAKSLEDFVQDYYLTQITKDDENFLEMEDYKVEKREV